MTIASPVRLGRLQAALVELVAGFLPAAATVLWSDQGRTRDMAADNLVVIRAPEGASALAVEGRRGYAAPVSVTLTVTAATANARWYVEANGLDATADYVALDTTTTVRNRLRASLALAGVDGGFAAADSGPASILLTPLEPGGLFNLTYAGPLSHVIGSTSPYRLSTGIRRCSIELQAYVRRVSTAGQSPRNGASDLLQRALSGFHLASTIARLERDGISIVDLAQPMPDLTALSGGETESRAAVDMTAWLRAFAWEPTDVIEVVTGTVQGRDPDNVITLAQIVAP